MKQHKVVVKLKTAMIESDYDIFNELGQKMGTVRQDNTLYKKKVIKDLEGNEIGWSVQASDGPFDTDWAYDLIYKGKTIGRLKEKGHLFHKEYFLRPQGLHLIGDFMSADLRVMWGNRQVMQVWHTSEMYENSIYCRVKCVVYEHPDDFPLALLIAVTLCN